MEAELPVMRACRKRSNCPRNGVARLAKPGVLAGEAGLAPTAVGVLRGGKGCDASVECFDPLGQPAIVEWQFPTQDVSQAGADKLIATHWFSGGNCRVTGVGVAGNQAVEPEEKIESRRQVRCPVDAVAKRPWARSPRTVSRKPVRQSAISSVNDRGGGLGSGRPPRWVIHSPNACNALPLVTESFARIEKDWPASAG